jgi:hypothetical protein
MIFSRAGGIPKDDTAFMSIVKEAGYTVERMKGETSRKNQSTLVIRESHPSKRKESARPREVQQKDRKVKERAREKKNLLRKRIKRNGRKNQQCLLPERMH